jgi:hypothetical protein
VFDASLFSYDGLRLVFGVRLFVRKPTSKEPLTESIWLQTDEDENSDIVCFNYRTLFAGGDENRRG